MIQSKMKPATKPKVVDANVVVLNNYLRPHHCKQLQACAKRIRDFTVLLSTPMEPNRNWQPQWGDLDVVLQRNIMVKRKWRHKSGFVDDNYVHVPWDTLRQLRRLKPDVILSYEMGARTFLSSRYRARHPECALVVVNNISELTERHRGFLRPRLRRSLLRRIDLATYNGPSCKRYLLQQGLREDQLFYFPYCHDAAKVYDGQKTFSEQPQKLFYGGSISQRKGIVPFCHALTRWCKANPQRVINFTIVGDGPLRLVVETLATPANLHIKLNQSASAEQMRDYYAANDITVFPTLADEWAMVVNESLASGTPMLASTGAQATEVLCRDGQNSWVFDAESERSMDEALVRALSTSAEQLSEMSRAARQSVAHINPNRSADLLADIVTSALRLRRK